MRCSIVTPYARTYNPHSTILYLGLYFRLNCHNIYYQSLITNDPNAINRDNYSHSGTKKICVKVPLIGFCGAVAQLVRAANS